MTDAQAKKLSSWKRAKHRIAHSIKLRMVLVFLLLAAGVTFVFFTGAQKAFSMGWREAARPLLMDYVDRIAAEITNGGQPSVERALAVTERLPLTVRIAGPQVNWASHPGQVESDWMRDKPDDGGPRNGERNGEKWGGGKDWNGILQRTTADGHTIEFGLNDVVFERRPRLIGYALTSLLVLTLLAWLYVRRLLKPLDAIGEGARRFGAGDFSQPIPERCLHGPDELGELAATINTMGQDIHQMLEAKRALLLAISHELRSPLTRARLNTELLPESPDVNPQREALMRDLKEMAGLITDLLESERLSAKHAALQREPVALAALAQEVVAEVLARQPMRPDARTEIAFHADPTLPPLALDPSRIRLLLRNLLDNALRHSAGAPLPPELHLRADGRGLQIEVRDHGPGVPDDQLPHLAEPFFRPDTARTRAQGGVGLGLHLCKLVAQAHGGTFAVRNARPGLAVTVSLPG
ncbi:HAMP domain-containing sensor histidine kinase [Hydrogenophaga sp. SL48]|uniref:HAMP domain-containing sensor histidine kinase n=1 Tax=Hydrogenophaga sp. SL48 TaxID=2806347 RepID=UPI001F38C754|nr:HAMP domain-containing sensor histidine kinase [Hydrogenophaga sp. SL48]UJW83461.1 HAMP domain-containing histidine kinase [Hydrogenophaga sp. SL48]